MEKVDNNNPEIVKEKIFYMNNPVVNQMLFDVLHFRSQWLYEKALTEGLKPLDGLGQQDEYKQIVKELEERYENLYKKLTTEK